MKKFFLLSIAVLFALTGCKKEGSNTKITSLEFKKGLYEIYENEGDKNMKKELVAAPDGILDKEKIAWTVSDEEVAQMNGNFLSPIMPGDVKVTATVQGMSATCKVSVLPVQVEKITLNSMEVPLYGSKMIDCTTEPTVSMKRISFSSSSDDIAYVDYDGTVYGKGVGKATITAEVDGKKATCEVDVKKINVTKVIVSPSAYRLNGVGEQVQLTATIEPENASVKNVSWKSDNESVATVDENGMVTTHAEGNAIITAKADGVSGQCSISMVNYGLLTDIEGNTYRTIKIGNQVWMADNLKCKKYTQNSGVSCTMSHYTVCPSNDYEKFNPYYIDPSDKSIWASTIDNKLSDEQLSRAGYLYNWAAAMGLSNGLGDIPESSGNRQGICPDGWHLPKMSELTALENYIDNKYGKNSYSRHLYSSSGWIEMYIDGEWIKEQGYDTFGFDAMPIGWSNATYDAGELMKVHSSGRYFNIWTATQSSPDATKRYAESFRTDSSNTRDSAYSVRCVKN